MKQIIRGTFIIAEVVIAFTPIFGLWCLGLLFIPLPFLAEIITGQTESLFDVENLLALFSVITGGLGIKALFILSLKAFDPTYIIKHPKRILVRIFSGISALIAAQLLFKEIIFLFIPAYFVCVHFLYIARKDLFLKNTTQNPTDKNYKKQPNITLNKNHHHRFLLNVVP